MAQMHIGELAQNAGVNVQTVRFYERKRILPAPQRTQAGYRSYGPADLENIRFIRRCQDIGFTLQDITQLMRLHRAVAKPSSNSRRPRELREMTQLARFRLKNVEEKLRTLRAMRMQLLNMIDQFESNPLPACPAANQAKPR